MNTIQSLQEQLDTLKKENSQLRQMAERDGLTGCLRREALMGLIERRRSFGLLPKNLSLVVADIDFFKKVNDKYGHIAGDEVLKNFAQKLQDKLPSGSLVARMGGEEFLILLSETCTESARIIEELRLEVANADLKLSDGRKLHISVSFGMANWDSDQNLLKSVAAADAALYESKHQGRNRLTLAA